MSLIVPDGAPRFRYMRYVRPPSAVTDPHERNGPLFPLFPSTRKIRVAVDVATLAEPTSELLRILARGDEVEPLLLVQNDEYEPRTWTEALETSRWFRFEFTSVEEAPRVADTSTVGITGYSDGEADLWTLGYFFSVFAQLDQSAGDAYADETGLTLADRHRAAALAATAATLGADVIVTAVLTAGRDDVADNDSVISVSPAQLHPLFGHYLRVTNNCVLESSTRRGRNGGRSTHTLRAASIASVYLSGIDASVPHLSAIRLMAGMGGDYVLEQSAAAIEVRLSRAARAVDSLLAALSNGGFTDQERVDTVETTAEAFERVLLYLCAAMDRYGRITRTLLDTRLDPETQRYSLTSTKELRTTIDQFVPTDTARLDVLGSYAWVIGQLRNRIHALPLTTETQLSRSYGSSTTVTVSLAGIAELAPDTTLLNQDQLDRLGVFNAQSRNPFAAPTYSADIATLTTTLFKETLSYLEEFSHFLLRNKVKDTAAAPVHRALGCWADDPRPKPPEHADEKRSRERLGWADFG